MAAVSGPVHLAARCETAFHRERKPAVGRYAIDLQRDSRVADIMVRPVSPTNPQKHRSSEHKQRSYQAERLGVQPPISHEPTLGRSIHTVHCARGM
jgi:hypothetical protein